MSKKTKVWKGRKQTLKRFNALLRPRKSNERERETSQRIEYIKKLRSKTTEKGFHNKNKRYLVLRGNHLFKYA